MSARTSEFVSLSRGEQSLLCGAAALLLASRVLLGVAGVDRTRGVLRVLVVAVPPFTRVEEPTRIPWAVRAAGRHLPGTYNCLPQAVVGETVLVDNGYRATVRLGVAKRAAAFEAHAWVERRGDVVIGDLDDLDRFHPLTAWTVGS